VIITVSLGIALVGENPVIVGGTVKMELVADPLGVVTVIDPVEAPSGTERRNLRIVDDGETGLHGTTVESKWRRTVQSPRSPTRL